MCVEEKQPRSSLAKVKEAHATQFEWVPAGLTSLQVCKNLKGSDSMIFLWLSYATCLHLYSGLTCIYNIVIKDDIWQNLCRSYDVNVLHAIIATFVSRKHLFIFVCWFVVPFQTTWWHPWELFFSISNIFSWKWTNNVLNREKIPSRVSHDMKWAIYVCG